MVALFETSIPEDSLVLVLSLCKVVVSKSDFKAGSKFDASELSKDNFSSSTIKSEVTVLVTLLNSAALTVPSNMKNIKTTEINNVVFLIEIFTPSWFSL